jgi:hypothetical protein
MFFRTTISIRDMIFASELFIALIRKNWHLIDAAIASTYGYVIPLLLSSSVRVSFDVEQVKSELALKVSNHRFCFMFLNYY